MKTRSEIIKRLEQIRLILRAYSLEDMKEVPNKIFWLRVDLQGERVSLLELLEHTKK